MSENYLIKDLIKEKKEEYLQLAGYRKDDNPQLWTAGCSFTTGEGVNQNEAWPWVLASRMKISHTNLGVKSSSIAFSADQLIRSDIRTNDLIVWGLTYRNRFPYIINNKLEHLNAHNIDRYTDTDINFRALVLDDHNLQYQALIHIYQVINFVNKIGAKLILVGMCTDEGDELFYSDLPNYLKLTDNFIDHGTDGRHPGPSQHKIYADKIQEYLYGMGVDDEYF